MTTPLHVDLDLSAARRVITAGDVHGHLDLLLEALERVGFDASAGDVLLLLGDILDRGPDVLRLRDWLRATTPLRVLGNHDHMLIGSLDPRRRTDYANPFNLLRNGGDWIQDFAPGYEEPKRLGDLMVAMINDEDPKALVDPAIVEFAIELADAPIAIRVRTPGGRTVGFVHGDVPTASWDDMADALLSPSIETRRQTAEDCMWTRTRFDRAKKASRFGTPEPDGFSVPGVDHVFFGHSITVEPMTIGNVSWIDTGGYKHGLITALDVDAWIDALDA